MTRRLRLQRMHRRARETRTTELLRASGEEVRARVESGDWTINRARAELGLPPLGHYGDTDVEPRPNGLLDALQCDGLISDEERDEWQRAWDEIMAAEQPHRVQILLPHRAKWTPLPKRERKSNPRGLPRMREHTISLLLGALRGDGSLEATIRVSTCRAMRVLPWDIGHAHTSRITAGDGKPTGMAAVEAAYREHVIEPLAGFLSQGLPDGLEFVVSEDPRGTQIELAHPTSPWIDPNGDPTE